MGAERFTPSSVAGSALMTRTREGWGLLLEGLRALLLLAVMTWGVVGWDGLGWASDCAPPRGKGFAGHVLLAAMGGP